MATTTSLEYLKNNALVQPTPVWHATPGGGGYTYVDNFGWGYWSNTSPVSKTITPVTLDAAMNDAVTASLTTVTMDIDLPIGKADQVLMPLELIYDPALPYAYNAIPANTRKLSRYESEQQFSDPTNHPFKVIEGCVTRNKAAVSSFIVDSAVLPDYLRLLGDFNTLKRISQFAGVYKKSTLGKGSINKFDSNAVSIDSTYASGLSTSLTSMLGDVATPRLPRFLSQPYDDYKGRTSTNLAGGNKNRVLGSSAMIKAFLAEDNGIYTVSASATVVKTVLGATIRESSFLLSSDFGSDVMSAAITNKRRIGTGNILNKVTNRFFSSIKTISGVRAFGIQSGDVPKTFESDYWNYDLKASGIRINNPAAEVLPTKSLHLNYLYLYKNLVSSTAISSAHCGKFKVTSSLGLDTTFKPSAIASVFDSKPVCIYASHLPLLPPFLTDVTIDSVMSSKVIYPNSIKSKTLGNASLLKTFEDTNSLLNLPDASVLTISKALGNGYKAGYLSRLDAFKVVRKVTTTLNYSPILIGAEPSITYLMDNAKVLKAAGLSTKPLILDSYMEKQVWDRLKYEIPPSASAGWFATALSWLPTHDKKFSKDIFDVTRTGMVFNLEVIGTGVKDNSSTLVAPNYSHITQFNFTDHYWSDNQ